MPIVSTRLKIDLDLLYIKSSKPSLNCNTILFDLLELAWTAMPCRGRANLGRHTPVQRSCRRMRVNVPPFDQADVTALQQFILDAYAKIVSESLQFLRREQDHLRADNSKDIRETIVNQDRRAKECRTGGNFACYVLRRPTLHV